MKDVFRRKVMFLVAFGAVFICILANLLIDVIVKKGSLIYVKMSEDLPIDAKIRPSYRNRDKVENHFHINFTRIQELNMPEKMG